jgi:5-methylthioadenosine/S-adenosylhomocysteine deaminase
MSRTPCDLIVEAGWLLTMAPGAAALPGGAVAVAGGRIRAAGPAAEVYAGHAAPTVLRLPEHVLLPGLVNAHGHAGMTLFRGYAEGARLEDWLAKVVWPLEERHMSPDFVRDGTRLAIAEMIRSGTTCFADMYFFPETVAELAREIGIRCQVAFPVIAFPNAWSKSTADALHRGMELHDAYRNNPLVRVAFGPHAPYSVARDDLEKVLMYAEELDANVHMHLHETAAEVEQARARHGTTWIPRLHEIGLLGPRLQAIHGTQLDGDDIALLAEFGVHLVHCPHSNLKLASGVCPTAALVEAGVNVALGTDGAASNNGLDLLAEARLATLLARVSTGDARSMPDRQALELATLGGARALGLEAETGSLEAGKLADMIAVDFSAPRFQPVHDPVAQLVHTHAGSAVTHVWVAGQPIFADGRLTTLDEAAAIAGARKWRARIAQ